MTYQLAPANKKVQAKCIMKLACLIARCQIIRWSCKYMHTSNLDMVLFTIDPSGTKRLALVPGEIHLKVVV